MGGFDIASERLSQHIKRLLHQADEALTQRRKDVVQERAQDILAIAPENSEGATFLAAAASALSVSSTATEGPSPAAPVRLTSLSSPPPLPTASRGSSDS